MPRTKPLQALGLVSLFAISACTVTVDDATTDGADEDAAATVPVPRRIVDLGPVVTEDLPVRTWGAQALAGLGLPGTTEFDVRVIEEPTHISISLLTLLNHAGAHVDVPVHLEAGATALDEMPLETFVGPLRVLDFRTAPKDEPIGLEDVRAHQIEPGDVVVLLVDYTAPTAADEAPSYAYLSPEAAEYLASIPVRAFGTTGMSVDSFRELGAKMAAGETGYETLLPVHHAFLTRGIPAMEQLVNVAEVAGEEDALFVALPLKIEGGDGSPIRPAVFLY